MNIVCVKWGDKYSAEYANKLYSMVKRHAPTDIDFHCYTEDPTGLDENVNVIPIYSDLTKWWLKIDMLNHFESAILFDLDVIILNDLEKLFYTKTRTVSVLYSQWKEGILKLEDLSRQDMFHTMYNSSIMKWENYQGVPIYDYFQNQKEKILFKYKGIDRYFYNEPVDIDLLPTSIAYSYWSGSKKSFDTEPCKLRKDYEVCIFNEGIKQKEIDGWINEYWR